MTVGIGSDHIIIDPHDSIRLSTDSMMGASMIYTDRFS